MAKPVFIYAFDNLGPERFVELCGLILASRYKGFLLGGIGPDGGIDGEVDNFFGTWQPEIDSPLLNEIVHAKGKVVFQFKHKVTARVGQTKSRKELLNFFKTTKSNKSELTKNLIKEHKPSAYVLVTNVEINSYFRAEFIKQCKSENPDIQHYQIIGLDELELWVTMEQQIRHHFFPTIFGPPQYNLRIILSFGEVMLGHYGLGISDRKRLFQISILNIGSAPSYVDSIKIHVIENDARKEMQIAQMPGDKLMDSITPKPGEAIEPGRKSVYNYELSFISELFRNNKNVFPFEIIAYDEIGNAYRCEISKEMRDVFREYQ